MIRLPVERSRIGERLTLTPQERHYLVTVLRLSPGDALEVFDGEGGRHLATLADLETLALGPRSAQLPRREVVLAQGLAKGDKVELVVQKATELGASAIAPFSSERAVVKLEGARAVERVARWQKIAAEAARQCNRADVPEVRPIVSLEEVVRRAVQENAAPLLLWEEERLLKLSAAVARHAGPLLLIVGPEGGLSREEVARAVSAGAQTVTLGSRVLRTETVALAALAVVEFLEGELG